MFAFTKEELEARVASLLEGTPLMFEVTRSRTCLLMVGVELPIGFRLVHETLYREHNRSFPILGEFRPNDYPHMLVVKAGQTYGFPGLVFEFSPWDDDRNFNLDDELKKIEALAALFRIPI